MAPRPGMAHPDSATLKVLAILRAIGSVLKTCAALLTTEGALVRGAAGAVLALAATLVLLASVGVITLASTVVLCLLAKACQPAGGLVGVTCTE